MSFDPNIMQAIEQLNYRVTVGDVAAKAGLNVRVTQQSLLALASDVGGHLQVVNTGDIVYNFPNNFRNILQNKYFRLRLQKILDQVWGILFYLIKISFGILLILSLVIIIIAIIIIIVGLMFNQDDNNNNNSKSLVSVELIGRLFYCIFDWSWMFLNDDYNTHYHTNHNAEEEKTMDFLPAVFSFLFGDGDPNAKLEQARWTQIGMVIRNNQNAIVAEQISPYLDELGTGYNLEYESYMLPVLTKFNGVPQVDSEGNIIYAFPELQTTVQETNEPLIDDYLEEKLWKFSQAGESQISLSIFLGCFNFFGALILGFLLLKNHNLSKFGDLVIFVHSIYGVLLGYGIGFLAIPLGRYFWIQNKNSEIEKRNLQREQRAIALQEPDEKLQNKIASTRQFAAQNLITNQNITYSTETDLIEQELDE